MNLRKIILCLISVSFLGCHPESEKTTLLSYIDTRTGTAASTTKTAGMFGKKTEEYGQTLPAVLEPNGMNFWTPQTRQTEKKCIAPYYYKDTLLQGFRNSHWIVGGCTQDYGSMSIMPQFNELRWQPGKRGSLYSHENEIASPAYYAVTLDDDKLRAEMTGRSRAAIFRFTYEEDGNAYFIINPNSDEGEGYIEIDTLNKEIRGFNPVHRIYQGWGEPAGFDGYFIIRYNKPIISYGTFNADSIFHGNTQIGQKKDIGAFIQFKVNKNDQIIVKAASSFTDIDGARRNMETEIPHWDFNRTQQELTDIWENHLNKIQVKSNSKEEKEKFYGSMYRASFLPRQFNDVDGRYPSFAGGDSIMTLPDSINNYYTDYSMWDTYRALHPYINLIEPDKGGEMMQSLVLMYQQGGWLPIFPSWNSYTAAMIGDHCIAAIGDAYSKGIRNFDIEKAYEGMRKNAFESPESETDYKNGKGRRALDSYLKYGYIPLEDGVPDAFHTNEQVSRTLEYAYDDFVLAQIAKSLGKDDDYNQLMQRAQNYRNVIDPATGYMQGRYAAGDFLKENNAFEFSKFITEGAPCHYTWYAPQDIYGLIQAMGGKDVFSAKLDSMFSQQRYWHGNEPCHQIAYLFNYAGEPWKTQREVRHIMDTEYLNSPGGLSGNDDAGQMSAWYLFSALGFYPVCPGTPYYIIGSPSFEEATLHLENGKQFTIKAKGASSENIYISSVKLNGKIYNKNYLSHSDIMNGGCLEFIMSNEPDKNWGSAKESLPVNLIIE